MTNVVEVSNVSLSYPIYSVQAQSLRNTIANLAIGGRLLKDDKHIVHVKALDNVNFALSEGDRLGIIGHNGAGKTTMLKVLAGVYEPDFGEVTVKGKISSMIDIGLGLDANLTGRENIINMGRLRGFTTKDTINKIPEILEFSELGQFIDLPIKTYSAGMQARLVFAVSTSFEPDVLLLDEWLGAGDAGFFQKATDRMNDLLNNSRVMVLATHNSSLVKLVCNKLLVLDGGTQKYFGDVKGWDIEANKAA